MTEYQNLEFYLKVLLTVVGGVVSIGKFREYFSTIKNKQELKLDLEIIEKLKQIDNFDSDRIEKITRVKLEKYFESNSESITDFFIGMVMLVGFGYWSIDLFSSSVKFNGWIILTVFCSLTGLTLIIGNKPVQLEKDVFYKIGFYDKKNFVSSLVIMIFAGILTPILLIKIDGFSYWQFVSFLFFLFGFISLLRKIKRIN